MKIEWAEMHAIDQAAAGTILAALRAWQWFLVCGRWPVGERLAMLHEMAGEEPLSPEDIDELCESFSPSRR